MQRDTGDMDSADKEVSECISEMPSIDTTVRGDGELGSAQYMNTKEAADALCITQQTARNWLKAGLLKGYIVQVDKRPCIRITKDSVDSVKSGKAWKDNKDSNCLD